MRGEWSKEVRNPKSESVQKNLWLHIIIEALSQVDIRESHGLVMLHCMKSKTDVTAAVGLKVEFSEVCFKFL